ncbi:MAG: radical SAM family heme chaperone HemW [Candidatus Firestonebacteria bacterium]|nr:radical SAM family heme chaperone HemW [Candidatus Firestonebacteria bacterium]
MQIRSSAGLYLHIPFCLSKCSYCDFNSYPVLGYQGLISSYTDALLEEVKLKAGQFSIKTVFAGGGTPTVLPEEELKKVLTGIFNEAEINAGAEFTVEANPCTISVEKLKIMKNAGVNRLSIGLQTTDDRTLKLLGRLHTYRDFVTNYKKAREASFKNINIDLIFGVPGQTIKGLKTDLEKIVALNPEHISIYNLILEPGTQLEKYVAAGSCKALSDDVQADMYYIIKDYLEAEGYTHYEISNFARKGKECLHNIIYWKNEDFIGVGAGASGKIGRKRTENIEDISKYIVLLKEYKNDILHEQKISLAEEIAETVFLGLRMLEGLNLAGFKERFGKDFFILFKKEYSKLLDLKLLKEEEGSVKLTRTGLFLSNEVFVEFV